LRDYDYDYDKPHGVLRILVLGDSFAEAFQVPLELSFTKEIEKLLNRKSLPFQKVQVINAGTSGYGTDNELLFFRHEGYKYHADLVLLAFYIGNDVRNNWYELENADAGGSRKPYFLLGPQGLQPQLYPLERSDSILTRFKLYLNMHVRVYAFLRETTDRLRYEGTIRQVGMPPDYNLFRQTYTEPWSEAWRVTEALILQLHKEVTQRGADLFIVLIPAQYQVYRSYWEQSLQTYVDMRGKRWDLERPNRILASFLKRHGIKFIDLLPQFRACAERPETELYLVADGHWNAEGHHLAGRMISKSLWEQQLISGPTSKIPR
jgi:hypothetical protein